MGRTSAFRQYAAECTALTAIDASWNNPVPETKVVIVGAGASGLTAAGALHQRGIEAAVLEQDERLGGTWTARYDRLHLHTVRGFSGLAHYPIPSSYSRYLSRDEFVAYLNE